MKKDSLQYFTDPSETSGTSMSAYPTPHTWFAMSFSAEIDLIDAFIIGIEEHANKLFEEFQREKISADYPNSDEREKQIITSFRGVTDQAWDIEGVFKYEIPSTYRSAALITICGKFENLYSQLCEIFKKHYNVSIGHDEIRGGGVNKFADYLSICFGIDTNKSGEEWKKIVNIIHIRNRFTHHNGLVKLNDAKCEELQNINYLSLNITSQKPEKYPNNAIFEYKIFIGDGFLMDVRNLYQRYFNLLNSSIIENIKK